MYLESSLLKSNKTQEYVLHSLRTLILTVILSPVESLLYCPHADITKVNIITILISFSCKVSLYNSSIIYNI